MGRARPAPSRPAQPAQSTSAPPAQQASTPAPAPATTQASHAPPAAAAPQQAHPPAPVQDSGPGLGGMLMQGAAMGAGSAVGSMAVNAMFGGSSSSSAPPAAAPAQATNQCQQFDQLFHKCMAQSNNNMDDCNMVFKDLETCKKQYGLI
eukprot:TRINITY_DN1580_c0_g1_i2.p1 TRINITY_DN1580_c0_g1~~TRINITY_DN1580_c0_g1_i2.p1  ORF type:complete len:165 (+),score=44.08 TRINITY_DN1580_c0_g1_i2:51-497(+)